MSSRVTCLTYTPYIRALFASLIYMPASVMEATLY